jgi:hypothetical protein
MKKGEDQSISELPLRVGSLTRAELRKFIMSFVTSSQNLGFKLALQERYKLRLFLRKTFDLVFHKLQSELL